MITPKTIFVCHPLERLVSAYHSKLGDNVINKQYQLVVGTEIIRKYRSLPKPIALNNDDVTFPEFVYGDDFRIFGYPMDFLEKRQRKMRLLI